MQRKSTRVFCVLFAAALILCACAGAPEQPETGGKTGSRRAESWLLPLLKAGSAPFSVTVGGTGWEELLSRMRCEVTEGETEDGDKP